MAQEGLEDQLHLGNPGIQGVHKVLEVQTVLVGQGDLVDQEDPKDLLCLEVQEDQKALEDLPVLEALGDLKRRLFQEVLVIQVVLEVQEGQVDLGDKEGQGDLVDQHHLGGLGNLVVH